MTEFIGGIDYSRTRVKDDGLQCIQLEQCVGRDLDDFFHARIGAERVDVEYNWPKGGIRAIPNSFVAIYSRKAFKFPIMMIDQKLDSTINMRALYGFETGSRASGIWLSKLVNNTVILLAQLAFGIDWIGLRIEAILPTDWMTEWYRYIIKINKNGGELWVNDKLTAVILTGLPEGIPVWENNPPYSLGGIKSTLPTTITALLEAINGTPDEKLIPPASPKYTDHLVITDGEPLPLRQFVAYSENTTTKWNGLATSSVVTSHPIPVWGYPRKTLLFQSSDAGTLSVQVYAGGAWREWASITLTANTLEVYNLNGEVPISRCVYTPVGTDTIAVAEWMLSGQ